MRVPHADGTVVRAPPEMTSDKKDDRALILMADIFPTGFFGARNAFAMLRDQRLPASEATVVVVGCGPVGLCAIVSALEYGPRKVFAVDSVPARLEVARRLGAEPLNFAAAPAAGEGEGGKEAVLKRVLEVTEGRGADAVIEVVGLSPALRTAFELIRPFGVISSIGVHNAEVRLMVLGGLGSGFADRLARFRGTATRRISRFCSACMGVVYVLTGNSKNVKVQMGRCPVRSIFPEALPVLVKNQNKFRWVNPMSEESCVLTVAASCSTRSCRSRRRLRDTTCLTR